ncbi:unnamed protein product [Notodromas monacha]|uniref:C2H2-type domain-containing protein n=1 Tax=Notodromas monacha TaxID=399045 RepID=A0A7R9BIZ4_9CRUS|nr:unnamed protein product [Notodromas monacha]CAG0915492.1 unnamed protein product [Notodromas monacha]
MLPLESPLKSFVDFPTCAFSDFYSTYDAGYETDQGLVSSPSSESECDSVSTGSCLIQTQHLYDTKCSTIASSPPTESHFQSDFGPEIRYALLEGMQFGSTIDCRQRVVPEQQDTLWSTSSSSPCCFQETHPTSARNEVLFSIKSEPPSCTTTIVNDRFRVENGTTDGFGESHEFTGHESNLQYASAAGNDIKAPFEDADCVAFLSVSNDEDYWSRRRNSQKEAERVLGPVDDEHLLDVDPAGLSLSPSPSLSDAFLQDAEDSQSSLFEATDLEKICRWSGCWERFSTQSELVNHIESRHVEGKARRALLKYTETLLTGAADFGKLRAMFNEQAFSRLENLKIHMRSHTGERPYQCQHQDCPKAFSNSSDRAKHQRTHVDTRPYACTFEDCGKRYTDPSSLRKHMKNHPSRADQPSTPSELEEMDSSW